MSYQNTWEEQATMQGCRKHQVPNFAAQASAILRTRKCMRAHERRRTEKANNNHIQDGPLKGNIPALKKSTSTFSSCAQIPLHVASICANNVTSVSQNTNLFPLSRLSSCGRCAESKRVEERPRTWKVEEHRMLARQWRVESPIPPVAPMKTHVRLVGGDVAAFALCVRIVERETIIHR